MDGIGVILLQCTYDNASGKWPSLLATYTTLQYKLYFVQVWWGGGGQRKQCKWRFTDVWMFYSIFDINNCSVSINDHDNDSDLPMSVLYNNDNIINTSTRFISMMCDWLMLLFFHLFCTFFSQRLLYINFVNTNGSHGTRQAFPQFHIRILREFVFPINSHIFTFLMFSSWL